MSLLVFGTVALDDIKTPAGVRKDLLGGSAAHFAMSARLFTRVHVVAAVGKDFPRRHYDFLRKKGVDLSSLHITEGKTFHWQGEYKKENLNQAITLATELGVLVNSGVRVREAHRGIANIFLANIGPDMQLALLQQMRRPQFVGLDSMNLWINTQKSHLLKLMRQVDLFVANDGEARMLSGEGNLIKAAKFLRQCGPRLIVIKKGEHGVLFYSDRFHFSFSAYPVERVVDPTGAGDTFAGGLMGYLTRCRRIDLENLKKAVLCATTVASFNVEGFGMARTSRLTIRDVKSRMNALIRFIQP
jgi:sugar/nucleoside kinase (ribokinase family)